MQRTVAVSTPAGTEVFRSPWVGRPMGDGPEGGRGLQVRRRDPPGRTLAVRGGCAEISLLLEEMLTIVA